MVLLFRGDYLPSTDYNNILRAISADERRLFSERVRSLDAKILPGLGKLTWASQGVVEYFVKECRRHAGEIGKVRLRNCSAKFWTRELH